MPFLVITHFNKFLAFYDVYKYNMEEMMLPPRDACVLPTSKVNGGIIVVLLSVYSYKCAPVYVGSSTLVNTVQICLQFSGWMPFPPFSTATQNVCN